VIARRVHIDLALPRDPAAAADARRALRRTFVAVLHQQLLNDLYLVVSELVTNAVMHGQGPIRLRLQLDAGDVRGEVIDAGCGFEHELREAGPDATSGRGLLIVDRLTTRWGVHESTTHVWFEMLTGPRADTAQDRT
jgi:anti-sigma regulatory factor (Ser/Thr protein kinase)